MLSMWIGMLTERDEASVLDCYHRRAWETNTPAQQWHRYKRYHGGDVLTGGGRRILVDTRDREGAESYCQMLWIGLESGGALLRRFR